MYKLNVPSALKNLFYVLWTQSPMLRCVHILFKHRYSHSFLSLFLSISRSSTFRVHLKPLKTTTTLDDDDDQPHPTDIMKKTVKLMISISNKSNLITTNTNLILNEIMRCPRQPPTLISWRATITQPIPTRIDITIIIIDIKMPHRVRKVIIMFQFSWFIDFKFPDVIICPYSRFIIAMSLKKAEKYY